METNAITKAEFARSKGLNRSTVTRWVAAGRLVVDEQGNVLVTESELRLAETADASRHGVVERHARERSKKIVGAATKPDSDRGPRDHASYGKRLKESARREAAMAELAEMEVARVKGLLIDRVGVERALVDNQIAARQALERIPNDLALLLGAENDPEKIRGMLKQAIEKACHQVADMHQAMADTLKAVKYDQP